MILLVFFDLTYACTILCQLLFLLLSPLSWQTVVMVKHSRQCSSVQEKATRWPSAVIFLRSEYKVCEHAAPTARAFRCLTFWTLSGSGDDSDQLCGFIWLECCSRFGQSTAPCRWLCNWLPCWSLAPAEPAPAPSSWGSPLFAVYLWQKKKSLVNS